MKHLIHFSSTICLVLVITLIGAREQANTAQAADIPRAIRFHA